MIQDFKTAPINYPLTDLSLAGCKLVCGGVSWPTKQPGYATVLAMAPEKHFEGHDIYLLAEYENFDMRELIRWCGAADTRYRPLVWVGDDRNAAADAIINEMSVELRTPERGIEFPARTFTVCPTSLLEMPQLYSYILPHLKRMLDPDRRMLYLKQSNIASYMLAIEEAEIAEMKLGDCPAVEALAFAVMEIRDHFTQRKRRGVDTRRSAMA